MTKRLTRRGLLKTGALLGCSAAAHPLTTTMTFASAPGDARLVVILLRGGMDGLDVVRPVGDPNYATLRTSMGSGALPLDDFFAMHPGLGALHPLWLSGELAFAHAVSTPYRDKRSHFDGQDLLEAGTGPDVAGAGVRDGWLYRLLQTVPGATGQTAFAIGRETLKILSGDAPVANWAPDTPFDLSPQGQLLLGEIYKDHPLFQAAVTEAIALTDSMVAEGAMGEAGDDMIAEMAASARTGRAEVALASFAAERLNAETRIASFSINGWDTHRNQAGPLNQGLERLADTILTLKAGLGRNWGQTAVLAMTEFGRTARENGTKGTDHGTGGALLMAGGAIRGGRVFGRWPGLDEAELYDRRDLMPTGDVRAYAGWAMQGLFGTERSTIESAIFPGLDLGDDPGLLA